MKKNIIGFSIFFIIAIVMMLVFAGVFAGIKSNEGNNVLQEDTGYYVENYDIKINVKQDKKMLVQETITAHFNASSRGLVRKLPVYETVYESRNEKNLSFKGKNFKINYSNISIGDPEKFQTRDLTRDGDFLFLRVGKLNPESNFTETYKINYTMDLGDDRDRHKDSFYLNVLGTGWDCKINNFSYEVTLPQKDELIGKKYYVYEGRYQQDMFGNEHSLDSNVISGSTSNLAFGTAVTVKLDLPEKFFTFHYNHMSDYIITVVIVLTSTLGLLLFLKFRKKDPVTPVVEFSQPKGLTPTECGFIADGRTQNKDVTSLIVYWASKKIIKITENTDGKKSKDMILTKLSDLPSDAKKHEEVFFNSLFNGRNEVAISALNESTAEAGRACKTLVNASEKTFFTKSIDKMKSISLVIMAAMIGLAVVMANSEFQIIHAVIRVAFAIIMLLAVSLQSFQMQNKHTLKGWQNKTLIVLSIIFAIGGFIGYNFFFLESACDPWGLRFILSILLLLSGTCLYAIELYTKQGRDMLGSILGLKQYIIVTEKEKMEVLVKENPSLYYEILPYAYVLGVSDVYMEKFKDIPIADLVTDTVADPVIMYYTLDTFNDTISLMATQRFLSNTGNAISSVGSSSHHGGSRGGGFSGGGHGGGGGGRF